MARALEMTAVVITHLSKKKKGWSIKLRNAIVHPKDRTMIAGSDDMSVGQFGGMPTNSKSQHG